MSSKKWLPVRKPQRQYAITDILADYLKAIGGDASSPKVVAENLNGFHACGPSLLTVAINMSVSSGDSKQSTSGLLVREPSSQFIGHLSRKHLCPTRSNA